MKKRNLFDLLKRMHINLNLNLKKTLELLKNGF